MKKALISPNETVSCVTGWTQKYPYQPIFTVIPNAERVAEVISSTFEVAPPLYWVDCADDVAADQWYYDSIELNFVVIPDPVPPPEPPQPVVEGAQEI